MEYKTKPNTGSLFKNKTKPVAQSPDYRGNIVLDMKTIKIIDGLATVKISGWKTVGKTTGTEYVSLKVDLWEKPSEPQQDEDIPF